VAKKLAFKLAESLEEEFHLEQHPRWDLDEAVNCLVRELPLTRVEAQQEIDFFFSEDSDRKISRSKSAMDRIREAVGATPEMSLGTVLEAVAVKLETLKAAREEAVKNLAEVEEFIRSKP